MKQGQDITLPRHDRRDVIYRIEDEETGDPKNLVGHDATVLIRKGGRSPPIAAIASEDDDRLTVEGSDGRVTLEIREELSDLPVRSATISLVLRGPAEGGGHGSWTVATGTLTLTR